MGYKMMRNNINEKLGFDFYNQTCEKLAVSLLGKLMCRRLNNGKVISGYVVETEAYLGGPDKGSYSYNGRRTPGNEPMYMKPGTLFVYMTYGLYNCLNISSSEEGAAVLIRALQPHTGMADMQKLRSKGKYNKVLKPHQLCNGPAKMCMSLDISREQNKLDLVESTEVWFEHDPDSSLNALITEDNIIRTSRIGIASAGEEWANKPLRYYLKGNSSVSKKDRVQDRVLKTVRK